MGLAGAVLLRRVSSLRRWGILAVINNAGPLFLFTVNSTFRAHLQCFWVFALCPLMCLHDPAEVIKEPFCTEVKEKEKKNKKTKKGGLI